jgi:phosphoribosylformylglycinamidine synthase
VQSVHDISDGGLAVTVAESCFASINAFVGAQHAKPHLGANVNLEGGSLPAEHILFGERGARAILSVAPDKLAAVLATARQYNVSAQEIGQVSHVPALSIEYKGRRLIDSPVDRLCDVWTSSLQKILVPQ